MKPNRLNLCAEVREALIALGYSTVKVVNAVNAELGKATLTETTDKTGGGTIKSKGTEYAVTVTGSFKYTHKATVPCVFDAWHSAVSKVQKIAVTELSVPKVFIEWLDGFAKADAPTDNKPEAKPEVASKA